MGERLVPEEERYDRKDMYRLAVENTSDLVSFTTFTVDPIYTYINLSHKRVLGYTPEDLIGKSGLDFIHPDDKKKFLPLLKDYLSTKEKLPVGRESEVSESIQLRFKDTSGTWHNLVSTINIVGDELLFISKDISEDMQAEMELQESEEHFRLLTETALEGIYQLDSSGNFIFVNDAFTEILGYTREELLGKSALTVIPEQEWKKATAVSEGMSPEKPSRGEFAHKHKLGHEVPVYYSMIQQKKQGQIKGFTGTIIDNTRRQQAEIALKKAHDELEKRIEERTAELKAANESLKQEITERKLAEESVKRAENRLNNIIESSLDGIAVSDSLGYVTKANSAFLNMIGYEEQEILGKHIMEITVTEEGTYESTTGELIAITEEFVVLQWKIVENFFEAGALTNWDSYYLRKDKKIVPVEVNLSYAYDEHGAIIGSVGINRDITERKKAEGKLKEARDFLENVFKTSADGIILTDPQGKITRVNEAVEKILGYTQEELQEMHLSQLGNFDDTFCLWLRKNMVGKLFEDGVYKEFEALWKRKDGKLISFELNAALLRNREGDVIGRVICARDISERKKIQEMEMKNAFIANISHEFRTPLTLSIGPLEGLLRGEYGYIGTGAKDQIGLALRNNRRQLKLINQLLEFTRLGSKSDEVSYYKKDINLFVSALVDSFAFLAIKKDINLAFIPDEAIEAAYIDPGKLERVLLNIIGNAFKFTPRGGSITITTKNGKENVEENFIKISVHDTGIGIKEEDLPHIFERFQQIGSNPSRRGEGSGIGLSLAKELIELQKGKIETESTYGGGSTFTIYLPLGKDHISDQDQINYERDEIMLSEKEIELSDLGYEEDGMREEKPTGTRPLILFIDDNPDVRRYVTGILGKEYEVITAEDGLNGLEKLKDYTPDVIISDIMMPRMDGYEFCKSVKSNTALRHIPFIFLTAKADTAFKIESLQEGADDYIVKPFNSQELLARVGSLLRIQSLLRENILQEKRIAKLQEALGERHHYHNLIGKSPAMQECYSFLEKIKDSESPVLIFGETGTGKELVAHAIQSNSKRKDNPFIILNCTSINKNLLESELFGHIKGAFTGAIADKKGIFEVADGGTLFLDEIAEMSLATQVKLLRVLEEGTFRSAGSTVEKKVKVRIIAATNKDLKELIEKGRFREDLYYRINVITITLPPLRERKEDIPLLVDYFIKESSGKGGEMMVSENALRQLTDYNYPGNVRELRNIIERALTLCENNLITYKDLPQEVVKEAREEQAPSDERKEELTLEDKKEQMERETIVRVLKQVNGNKFKAAKILNISRSTLYAKIEKLRIEY